jgi:hypothetical protein
MGRRVSTSETACGAKSGFHWTYERDFERCRKSLTTNSPFRGHKLFLLIVKELTAANAPAVFRGTGPLELQLAQKNITERSVE